MIMEQDLIPGLPHDIAVECLIRVDLDTLFVLPSICRCWRQNFFSPEFSRRRRVGGHSQPCLAFLMYDTEYTTLFVVLFDPTSEKWRRLPAFPYSRRFCSYRILEAGQRIVFVDSPNTNFHGSMSFVHIYDFYTGKWRAGAPFPRPHRDLFAIASDGMNRIFVAGGRNRDVDNQDCHPIRSAILYNVDDDSWCPLPDMAEARAFCQGIFNAGIFHVIAGSDLDTRLTSAEQFHSSTGCWSQESKQLKFPRHGLICINGNDGKCYHFDFSNWKLMVKEGESWKFVCNFSTGGQT